jgi:SNF2-related domain
MRLGLAYEYDPFFSLSIARVDPLPHQLEAVYDYFIKLPRIRFLLADDPGAGKTIMAGLLIKELKIRGLAKRTLIVTPANLSFQWQRELKDKFRESFEVVRSDVLRANYGMNPWQEKNQVITSVAARRAVICAALWPDPADPLCPQDFRDKASRLITEFATAAVTDRAIGESCDHQTWVKWQALVKSGGLDGRNEAHWNVLRFALLDFIADFANWDNATERSYLETTRRLTLAAHEALGGESGTRPYHGPFCGRRCDTPRSPTRGCRHIRQRSQSDTCPAIKSHSRIRPDIPTSPC